MNKSKQTNVAVSLVLGFLLTLVLEMAYFLQQTGLFILEATVVSIAIVRVATENGIDLYTFALTMPGLRLNMAGTTGSMRHHHGSALHWSVAVIAGLVITLILGQSVLALFGVPVTVSVTGLLGLFVIQPLLFIVFVVITLGWYYLLKKY